MVIFMELFFEDWEMLKNKCCGEEEEERCRCKKSEADWQVGQRQTWIMGTNVAKTDLIIAADDSL